MNALTLKSWSERQQVLAVILMAGVVIFVLWFFLLLPQTRARRNLEDGIKAQRSQLERQGYLLPEESLKERKNEELRYNKQLDEEWRGMTGHVAAFSNTIAEADSRFGRINYKVALSEVRQRLQRKSNELGISLPYDLGMDDQVRSDEDSRKLMLQLHAVEKLVDLALDLKIDALKNVEPLPPVQHETGANKDYFLEEYPVRLDCFGSLDDVYNLLNASLVRGHVFALRRLRIEASSAARPDVLNIRAVMSALVFLREPDGISLVPQKKTAAFTGPLGH